MKMVKGVREGGGGERTAAAYWMERQSELMLGMGTWPAAFA